MQAEKLYAQAQPLDRGALLESFAPQVKRIALQLSARLPANIELDDLVQYGMLGLIDASQRYTEGLGARFETYAARRVRGAMLDGLRENDWLPRSSRRHMREIESAMHSLEQQLGRQPSEGELADHLQVPLAEYQRRLEDGRGHQLVYLEDFAGDEDDSLLDRLVGEGQANPLAILEDADTHKRLVTAVAELPEREKLVMGLYYNEELNLREIGEVLGVTESRVCQLHSQAIARLRVRVFAGMAEPGKPGARRGRPPKKNEQTA